jgi:hypothetical protein
MPHDTKYGPVTIPGVPDDEPIFILRAQDAASVGTLQHYAQLCSEWGSPPTHIDNAHRVTERFDEWQQAHGPQVKAPD